MTAKPKSFLLYASYGSMIARLSLEERGTLLTALFDYVNGWEVDEENMTVPVAIVFCTIRDGIDRDREAYEEKCAKNTANGRLGGRPKKDQKTDRFFDEPKKANNNNNNNNSNNNNYNYNYDNNNERSEAPQIARGGAREQEKEKRNYGTRGRVQNFTNSSIDDEDEFFAAALRRSQRVLEENFARTQAGG